MIKTICDMTSRILLRFDIVEGQQADALKEYNDCWGKATACTLRLAEPYFGSWRTVVGDSWFGSVSTAVALKKYKLQFVGNVKIGYSGYPL
jgi:hypothetical protein